MPGDLDDLMLLATAGRYAHADDNAAILPRIYGDFLDPLVLPADLEDGGPLPTACIDTDNWVFLMNDGPLPAHAPQIYANDTLVEPIAANGSPVYFFNPAADYEGLGHVIAGVIFFANPGPRTITWRGQGTTQGVGGPLVTNPINGFFDAFSKYGGWTLDDFDLSIGLETLRRLDTLGVQFQWCFWQQRTYREWLNEILRCYFVDYFKTSSGKLAIQLDTAILGLPTMVLSTIDADTDLEATADDVEFEVDQQNIVNTLTVKRRLKWTDLKYTDTPTVDFKASVNLYGPLRGEVELPACYTDVHGLAWVQAFFGRYSFLPGIVRFTVRGLGHLTDLPGTFIGFLNPWFGWTQPRLLKVLNAETDANDGSPRMAFECFDCGRFVDEPVTLPSSPITSVRRRVRTATPTVDLVPPGPASNLVATGSYRRIVLRWTAPLDLDYHHTEVWAATVNNRASATFYRNGGQNVSPGELCEESFEAIEGTTYYTWLMTVDRQGNGKNGGTETTGGHWFPVSPTAGVPASAEPVGGPLDMTPPGPASNLVATGSYRRVVLRWRTPVQVDYDHTEIWASTTNNRATANLICTGGQGVHPGDECEETFEVLEGVTWFVWLMTVDTSGNGKNGGTGPTGGNWFPTSPTGGIPAASALINTPAIAPQAITQRYFVLSGFSGVTTGLTALTAVTAPLLPNAGYFDILAVSLIQVPANCILIHEIHQASQNGPLMGQQIFTNTIVGPVQRSFVVLGRASLPVWGSLYGSTANVINTSGVDVPFTVLNSGFEIIHVKHS